MTKTLEFVFGYAAGVLLRHHAVPASLARGLVWMGAIGVLASTAALNAGASLQARSLWLGLPIAAFALGVAALEQDNISAIWVSLLSQR